MKENNHILDLPFNVEFKKHETDKYGCIIEITNNDAGLSLHDVLHFLAAKIVTNDIYAKLDSH